MSPTKTKTLKKKSKAEEQPEEVAEETHTDGEDDGFPIKPKKESVVTLDEHVEVEVPEEKPEEDSPIKIDAEEEDLLGGEIGLDDDELNPFGDKWEE